MSKKSNQLTDNPAVALRRMVRPPVKYLHTIRGEPGNYDGYQIVYAVRTTPIHLVESLRQIRTEQKLSVKHRIADGFQADPKQYCYKRVYVA